MAALGGRAFLSAVAGRHRGRLDTGAVAQVGLRFVFYGRMSTSEFQDAVTSRAWQRSVSEELIEGFGTIMVEFFDEGCSRRWSWSDRPAASALLAAAEDPDRGFDAVVMGEHERAFYGDQFRQVVARLSWIVRCIRRRVGFWVVDRRMGIASRMLVHIRTPCTRDGVGGCMCWSRIR